MGYSLAGKKLCTGSRRASPSSGRGVDRTTRLGLGGGVLGGGGLVALSGGGGSAAGPASAVAGGVSTITSVPPLQLVSQIS